MSIEERAKQRVLESTQRAIDERLKSKTVPTTKSSPQENFDKKTEENENTSKMEIEKLKRQLESSENQQNLLSEKLKNQEQNYNKIILDNKNNYEKALEELAVKINKYEEDLLMVSKNNFNLLADIADLAVDQSLKDQAFKAIQTKCLSFVLEDGCVGGMILEVKSDNIISERIQFCCKYEGSLEPIIGLNNGLLEII